MFCIDIINIIGSFSKPLDVLSIKLLCKEFNKIYHKNIYDLFKEKINQVVGLEEDHTFAVGLLTIIKKYKELSISGSLILQILNQEDYENSDIDIYCNIKGIVSRNENINNFDPFRELLKYFNNFEILRIQNGLHPTYMINSWLIKHINKKSNGKKVFDIILMPSSARDRIANLKELSFCNNYYNGDTLFLSNYSHIINKTGYLEYSILMNKYLESDGGSKISKLFTRLEKYYQRDYTIKINKDFFKYALYSSLVERDYSRRKDIIHITKSNVVLYIINTTGDDCKIILENCSENSNYVIFKDYNENKINNNITNCNICQLQPCYCTVKNNNIDLSNLFNINEYEDDDKFMINYNMNNNINSNFKRKKRVTKLNKNDNFDDSFTNDKEEEIMLYNKTQLAQHIVNKYYLNKKNDTYCRKININKILKILEYII